MTAAAKTFDDRRRLLAHLRAWRQYRFLSQRDLAKASGVSSGHISMIERQESGVSYDTLSRLSKALNIDAMTLAHRGPSATDQKAYERTDAAS